MLDLALAPGALCTSLPGGGLKDKAEAYLEGCCGSSEPEILLIRPTGFVPAGEGYEDFEAATRCSDWISGMLECMLMDAQRLRKLQTHVCITTLQQQRSPPH